MMITSAATGPSALIPATIPALYLAAAESAGVDVKTFILGTVIAYETCCQMVDHTQLHPRVRRCAGGTIRYSTR